MTPWYHSDVHAMQSAPRVGGTKSQKLKVAVGGAVKNEVDIVKESWGSLERNAQCRWYVTLEPP